MFNRPENERHNGCSIAAYATFRSEAGGFHGFPNAAKETSAMSQRLPVSGAARKRPILVSCQTLWIKFGSVESWRLDEQVCGITSLQ
jgi:hypothetical protein